MGYHRAGFNEIVGVDNLPMPRYPFSFVLMDALEAMRVLLAGEVITDTNGRKYYLSDFDAIHASPPCQEYTTLSAVNRIRGHHKPAPDLIDDTRWALIETRKTYVIENVQGAPLQTQFILCGHSLGLERLARHRHFECSIFIPRIRCTHRKVDGLVGVYGDLNGRRVSVKKYKWTRAAKNLLDASDAMKIDWMNEHEITQAIPPAYTEYIGKYLIDHIRGRQ